MSGANPQYTRRWSICRSFAANANCTRGASCKYNHSLIDTTRIVSLVGHVSQLSFSSSYTSATTSAQPSEQTLFLIEYTKYSAQADLSSSLTDAGALWWRMRLCGGGRATLDAGAESVSVQPTYPVKGQGSQAGVALGILEGRVFGRSALPDPERPSLCKAHAEGVCTWGPSCRFSHTLFDTKRIETLLEEAVSEREYKEFRPILEIEYLARQNAQGVVTCVWRVTLRCVLGYHQKAAPQPVVVTSVDLNMAVRLLEKQFAASSGKPQTAELQRAQKNARTRRGSSSHMPQQTDTHGHTASTANAANRAEPRPQITTSAVAGTSIPPPGPPPSYHDALRGNYARPTSQDTKRRL